MAVTQITHVRHNLAQQVTYDGVITRIGTLENNNLKALLLSLVGKSENICFYGLGISIVSGLIVKVDAGILAQYVDDFEMLLGISPASSSNITLSAAHTSLNRIDIIQAKVQQISTNSVTRNIWDNMTETWSPQVIDIDYMTEIVFSKKDGTAGSGIAPTPDAGYLKIAEITVLANAVNLTTSNIKDIYSQIGWTIAQNIVINKDLDVLRTDLDTLKAELDNFIATQQGFSVSDNTTVKSTLHPLQQNPKALTSMAGYLDSNPFITDFAGDGRLRFGMEFIKPKNFWRDEFGYFQTEDERLRFIGGWDKDSDGFYYCYKNGDAVYITFYGTSLLAYVKSSSVATDGLYIKVDGSSPVSQDLNFGIDVNKGSLIKLADNLLEGVHTVKVYLNEDRLFAIKGFVIFNPISDSKIRVNKGSHYILDTNVLFSSTTEIDLVDYSDNGQRDIIFATRAGTIELGSGNNVGSIPLYGVSTDHANEEVSFEMDVLNYYNLISDADDWTGILATSDFALYDNEQSILWSNTISTSRVQLRFHGTGCDIDINVASGNITYSIDGVAQTAITPVAGKRQIVKLASNLPYQSHVIDITFSALSINVFFYNSIIYRPLAASQLYSDKVAIGAVNRVKANTYRSHHLNKLSLVNGANWSEVSNINCYAGLSIYSANTVASETNSFWFIGDNVILYGTKGGDKGIFNITIDTTTVTGLDCYALTTQYNAQLYDAISLGLTYGLHQVIITTTGTKNGSSSGYGLEFSYIAVKQAKAFLDFENNFLNCKNEIMRKKGIQQQLNDLKKTDELEHTWNDKTHNTFDSRINLINTTLLSYRKQKTYNTKYNFWGEIAWKSNSIVTIKPKIISGNKWTAGILNTGEYIEDTVNDFSLDITVAGNRADGLSLLTNEWYAIYGYKDSSNTLQFIYGWMPQTTLNAANPIQTLTLNQVGGQDISKLFPVDSEIALFESSSKIETPIWYTAGTYDPLRNKCKISSYPGANQVYLNAALSIATFAATTTKVYQVSNFKPLNYSTGDLASVITSARGWFDTGIRVRTDGSGNIYQFSISEGKFRYAALSTNWEGFAETNGDAVGKLSYAPPDCLLVWAGISCFGGGAVHHRMYWETYRQLYDTTIPVYDNPHSQHGYWGVKHGLSCFWGDGRLVNLYGWEV